MRDSLSIMAKVIVYCIGQPSDGAEALPGPQSNMVTILQPAPKNLVFRDWPDPNDAEGFHKGFELLSCKVKQRIHSLL